LGEKPLQFIKAALHIADGISGHRKP